ncbi:hypothetical protein HC766_08485 [Candidatus Gracilibacteria bacterium]|nr:hypothetical protein [Candidatus Gracilibacteria bacterium]
MCLQHLCRGTVKIHPGASSIAIISLLFQAFSSALEADSPASFNCRINFRFNNTNTVHGPIIMSNINIKDIKSVHRSPKMCQWYFPVGIPGISNIRRMRSY